MRTVFFLLLFSFSISAQALNIEQEQLYLAHTGSYFLQAKEKPLEINHVLQEQTQKRFQPWNRRIGIIGISFDTAWFKVQLENNSAKALKRILQVSLSNHITHAWVHQEGREPVKLDLWREGSWEQLYQITLEPNQKIDLYASSAAPHGAGFILELILSSEEEYWEDQLATQILITLYYGALFALAAYNLFLFFSLRDISYLFYVGTTLSLGVYLGSISGLGMAYLWEPMQNPFIGFSSGAFTASLIVLFSTELLHTKTHCPRWHRVNIVYASFNFLLFLLLFIFPLHYISDTIFIWGEFLPVVLIGNCLLCYKYIKRPVVFFFLGWIGFLIAHTLMNLMLVGYPLVDLTITEGSFFQMFFCLVELIIFSIALADRINSLSKEKIIAQKNLVEAGKSYALELEGKVKERTLELKEANDTKDKFFSIISHDLRGPIGSLSVIFNDVLKSASDLEEDLFIAAQRTTKSTSQMLNNLLDWAHSQSGHLEVQPTYFDLNQPIEEVVNFLEPQAAQKHITLKMRLGQRLPVHADISMVTTVIRNLLSNAVKFTPEKGTIEIGAQEKDGQAHVSIKDNGRGIEKKILDRLFKIDEKVASSPDTANNIGSGLGLILCQEFVTKNGGHIGVDSTLGQGSNFWFQLPRVEAKAQETLAENIDFSGLKVLIADDNALHRETTANTLLKFSIYFDVAENGLEAVEKAKAKDYDFIFMDIDMPILNGIEATEQLQQQPNFKSIIIALSSYQQHELHSRIDSVNFASFLQKPLEKLKLIDTLTKLLHNP